jgi:hypothetical protein
MRPVLLTPATSGPVPSSAKPVVVHLPLRPVQSDHSTSGRGQLFRAELRLDKLDSDILPTGRFKLLQLAPVQ